jgi:peptidoglycan/LPS O-acetylase OafA/YrhL
VPVVPRASVSLVGVSDSRPARTAVIDELSPPPIKLFQRSGLQPEIQTLRAVAVSLVVLYHLWPNRVSGGYVGVDVFFVVSGFLITSHLLREVDTSGRLDLPGFWARRARRLLPASLLALVAVAVATVAVVPHGLWSRTFQEIGASALYVENWLLTINAVGYLTAHNAPSAVQHYWSLSVEEQFYIIWPVLIALTLLFVRGRRARSRPAVLVTLTAVTVASFIGSVIWTAQDPSAAYFVTPARAWEFGVGALLAFAPAFRGTRTITAAIGWIGIIGIIGISFVYNAATAFPGVAAVVPVLAAVAVIWSGSSMARWAVPRATNLRPVQYLGDISYSLYLWHWPLIVIVPFLVGHDLSTLDKLAILLAALVIAGLSKRFIEDRGRRLPALVTRKPRWTFLAVAAGMIIVLTISAVGAAQGAIPPPGTVAPTPTGNGSCFAAQATVASHHCAATAPINYAAAAAYARTEWDQTGKASCESAEETTNIQSCTFGKFAHPVETVALIGDSHIGHYFAAFEVLAKQLHWNVITYVRSECTGTGDDDVVVPGRPDDQAPCAEWGREATAAIIANHNIDAVFTSGFESVYRYGPKQTVLGPTPYVNEWAKFIKAGIDVYPIRDTPGPFPDVPTCLETDKSVTACSLAESTGLQRDPMIAAAKISGGSHVHLLDLSSRFCINGVCPPFIGGVVVYFDMSHVTTTYSRSLAPFLITAIRKAGGPLAPPKG